MPSDLSPKILDQMKNAGLPLSGTHSFKPKLVTNRNGARIIEKRAIQKGPKGGKRGFVDEQERIWIKDYAHGVLPDHWDVQIDDGDDYLRVDLNGEELP